LKLKKKIIIKKIKIKINMFSKINQKQNKKLKIGEIVEKFKLKQLTGDKSWLKREIKSEAINQAGLELAGFFSLKKKRSKRIILLSSKESEYISSFTIEEKEKKYLNLFQHNASAIFITKNFHDQEFICEQAKKVNYPIILVPFGTYDFYEKIVSYMTRKLAPSVNVHATLVNIYGYGVLIKGKPGIGKSESALNLIKKGHLFIGDDCIIITKLNNNLIGKCHPLLTNFIEVRGPGMLDISKMYGMHLLMKESKIDLIIELKNENEINIDEYNNQLKINLNKEKILNIAIPLIKIPVSFSKNLSQLIEVAVINLKLINNKINTNIEFNKRTKAFFKKEKEESK
jgi:HPr kinase/phosphorylase